MKRNRRPTTDSRRNGGSGLLQKIAANVSNVCVRARFALNSLWLLIHGDKGAIRIDLDKSYQELDVCLGKDVNPAQWKTIKTRKTPSIYQRFITSIKTGKNDQPDFARGAAIQKALSNDINIQTVNKTIEVLKYNRSAADGGKFARSGRRARAGRRQAR